MATNKGNINNVIDVQAVKSQIDYLQTSLIKITDQFGEIAVAIDKMNGKLKNASTYKEINNSLNENAKKIAEVDVLQKEHLKLAQQLIDKEKLLTAYNNGLGDAYKSVVKEGLKVADVKKKITQEVKEEINAKEAEISAYKQLTNQLRDNIKKYKDLAASGKENTKEAKELISVITEQDKKVKQIDASVGQHQRNVGNYRSSLEGLKGGIMSVVGALGIAGGLAGALELAKGIMNSTEAGADKFQATMSGVSSATGFLARALSTMDFTNLIKGFKDAYRAGVEYAESLDLEEDVRRAGELRKKDIDNQIIKLRTEAKLNSTSILQREEYLNKIKELENDKLKIDSEIASAALERELKNAENITKADRSMILELINNKGKYVDAMNEAAKIEAEINDKNKTYITDRRTGIMSEVVDYEAVNKAISQLSDEQQKMIELNRIDAILTAEKRDLIAKAISDQLDAEKELLSSKESLIKIENRVGKEQKENNENAIKSNDEIIADIKKRQEEEQRIIEEAEKEKIGDKQAYYDFVKRMTEKQKESLSQETQQSLLTISRNQEDEMKMLDDQLKNKLISVEDYEKRKNDILYKYSQESIKIAIDEAKKQLEIANLTETEKMAIKQKLIDLEKQLREGDTEHYKEQETGKKEFKIETEEQALEYAQGINDQLTAISDTIFNGQMAKLDAEAKRDEELKAEELERAGNNQEMKDQIEAKYSAKAKQREQERRKLEIQKAKQDKALGIINAIINTALAISKTIGTMGMPWAIPFVALAAALGAAQISSIASQPIPQYFKGREDGPAELAIVGERGSEGIELPGGKTYLTPSRPTLTFLPEHARVIPHQELLQAAGAFAMTPISRLPESYGHDYHELKNEIAGLKAGFDKVVKAINDKQELHINITERGLQAAAQRGANFTRYLNQNVRL